MSNHEGHSYIIVRNDLTPAQVAVQSCHAVWEAAQTWYCRHGDRSCAEEHHPNLVLVVVRDEEKLKETMQLVHDNDILYDYFREPDLGDTITAVCAEPLVGERCEVLSHYMLWGSDATTRITGDKGA